MTPNDHCHYIGFCPRGVERTNENTYCYKLTLEIDPLPNSQRGEFGYIDLYFHGKYHMIRETRNKQIANSIISVLAYTKPIKTKSGNNYPLQVIETLEILETMPTALACDTKEEPNDDDEEKKH